MSKKGGKTQAKEQSYDVRDVVLAKVRGYPPWPGMIVDPDSVPENVQNERPNAKTKKGNWYCVRFFPAGDYAWMVPKDISKLQQHEIEAYINEPYKRSGDLLAGYRIALNPAKWEEEREAQRVEAAEEEANAEIDQLDSDGEDEADDGEEKKSKSKKRKRDADAAPAKSKAKAKPKKGSAEPANKKRAGSAKAGKKNGAKSKAMVESEDDGGVEAEDEDAGPSKQTSPPPVKKTKREKEGEDDAEAALAGDPEAQKVRDWRHKLQKAFLNNKAVPKDEDMPALDQLFTTVETYENMSISYLSFSKIGKVMRHIHALPAEKVPRDAEFKFRERARTLVDKWHDILNANKPNGTAAEGAKATSNGTSPSTKAADAADAGATTNGKLESPEPPKAEASNDAMDVDTDAKAEEPAKVEALAAVETGEAEAEGEPETNEDAPADPAADESALADVTMSEAV
ncbi:hypothetical protein WOLCODRAFT_28250 [Wolfiporia cocos MD-104 SS10]|uniref:PWWP domain-containing protein n=1 Tax=Wolfiporia cocos (strain MD-104) TaxID=742152 RepID=A0A2H3JE76_WOLCO|nr:hypothetical protein WOLCODRAFT_28250 [Wolfiporia cocos MD-104 SS10]